MTLVTMAYRRNVPRCYTTSLFNRTLTRTVGKRFATLLHAIAYREVRQGLDGDDDRRQGGLGVLGSGENLRAGVTHVSSRASRARSARHYG